MPVLPDFLPDLPNLFFLSGEIDNRSGTTGIVRGPVVR